MSRNRMFGVGVSSALALACAAYATPQESVTFNNVITEGLLGDPANTVLTHTFTGTYTVTKLRLNASLFSTSTGTWPADSRIQVQTPSGQIFEVQPFTQIGGFTSVSTPGDFIVNMPNPEVAAGTWTFTFFEDYNDTGTDAYWEPAVITLDNEAPPPPPPPANFQEIEGNDIKDAANLVIDIAAGQTVGGLTMGASTTTPGNTSADYFKVKTRTAPSGIYRHRLSFVSTGGTAVPTASIRGLSQTDGFINPGTDVAVQTAATTTDPASTVQWYGFGRQEELYVAVMGSSASNTEYRGTYDVSPVTPIEAGSFITGEITIDRDPGNFADADFMVYDSTFTAMPGYSNDGGNTLTRNFEPGTYYIAFSNWNTANDQPAPIDDTYPSENVMDFPNVVVNNSTSTFANMNIQVTDITGAPTIITGSKDGFFDVVWYRFTVANPTGPIPPRGTGTAIPGTAQITSDVLLTVQAYAGINPPSTGLQVRADLTSLNGGANQAFYDDGTHGDEAAGDNVFSYLATLAEPMTAGPVSVPFTVSDAELRTGTGTITFNATAAPTGGCCVASDCSLMSAYACNQAGGTYRGNGSDCGSVSYNFSDSNIEFATISGTGVMLNTVSNCDDCTESVALPFTFNFFGTDYTTIYVSSNGNVQFGGFGSAAYFNTGIPNTGTPNDAAYPKWDDYDTSDSTGYGQGSIFMQEFGTAPNRRVVIEWNNVTQFTAAATYPFTSETFQVILHEGSNNIEFAYGSNSPVDTSGLNQGSGTDGSGGDCTIGVENASGTTAYSIPSAGFNFGAQLLTFTNTPVCGNPCPGNECGPQDYNCGGDSGPDQDIEAFFACLGGTCCETCYCQGSDFNGDGDFGTDQDIEAFFRVLGGNPC